MDIGTNELTRPFRIPRKKAGEDRALNIDDKIKRRRLGDDSELRSPLLPTSARKNDSTFASRIIPPANKKPTNGHEKQTKKKQPTKIPNDEEVFEKILVSMSNTPKERKRDATATEDVDEPGPSGLSIINKTHQQRGVISQLTREKLERRSLDNTSCYNFMKREGLMERLLGHKMLTGRVDSHVVLGFVPMDPIDQNLTRIRANLNGNKVDDFPEICEPPPVLIEERKGPKTPPGSPGHDANSSLMSSHGVGSGSPASPPPPPPPIDDGFLSHLEESTTKIAQKAPNLLAEMAELTKLPHNQLAECLGEELQQAMEQVDHAVLLNTLKDALLKVGKKKENFIEERNQVTKEDEQSSQLGAPIECAPAPVEMDLESEQSDIYNTALLPPPPPAPCSPQARAINPLAASVSVNPSLSTSSPILIQSMHSCILPTPPPPPPPLPPPPLSLASIMPTNVANGSMQLLDTAASNMFHHFYQQQPQQSLDPPPIMSSINSFNTSLPPMYTSMGFPLAPSVTPLPLMRPLTPVGDSQPVLHNAINNPKTCQPQNFLAYNQQNTKAIQLESQQQQRQSWNKPSMPVPLMSVRLSSSFVPPHQSDISCPPPVPAEHRPVLHTYVSSANYTVHSSTSFSMQHQPPSLTLTSQMFNPRMPCLPGTTSLASNLPSTTATTVGTSEQLSMAKDPNSMTKMETSKSPTIISERDPIITNDLMPQYTLQTKSIAVPTSGTMQWNPTNLMDNSHSKMFNSHPTLASSQFINVPPNFSLPPPPFVMHDITAPVKGADDSSFRKTSENNNLILSPKVRMTVQPSINSSNQVAPPSMLIPNQLSHGYESRKSPNPTSASWTDDAAGSPSPSVRLQRVDDSSIGRYGHLESHTSLSSSYTENQQKHCSIPSSQSVIKTLLSALSIPQGNSGSNLSINNTTTHSSNTLKNRTAESPIVQQATSNVSTKELETQNDVDFCWPPSGIDRSVCPTKISTMEKDSSTVKSAAEASATTSNIVTSGDILMPTTSSSASMPKVFFNQPLIPMNTRPPNPIKRGMHVPAARNIFRNHPPLPAVMSRGHRPGIGVPQSMKPLVRPGMLSRHRPPPFFVRRPPLQPAPLRMICTPFPPRPPLRR